MLFNFQVKKKILIFNRNIIKYMKAHGLCIIIVPTVLLFEGSHVWLQQIIALATSHACTHPHFARQILFIFQNFVE
jgi:hypothetical protein